MICPCCQPENVNDLDNTFTEKRAFKDAESYLKKGLSQRAKKLIAYFVQPSTEPFTVLEVGCGAGAVHQQLLRDGTAESVVGVDASSAYLQAAGQNAKKLGLSERVRYEHLDFAQSAEQFDEADVVILDRVICCYPHLAQLLGASAERAKRFLAISYPINNFASRLGGKIADLFLNLMGSGYHPYVHPEREVLAVTENAGMKLVHSDRYFFWQIQVFVRA